MLVYSQWTISFPQGSTSLAIVTSTSIKVVPKKGKRSNMSAKGLSGKISFIPEYITIHRFSTKFKLDLAFL